MKKYTTLYAIMLDGSILTQNGLFAYRSAHPEAKNEDFFFLSGSGQKRVFFNMGAATAQVNRMPQWLAKVVEIHEFKSTQSVTPLDIHEDELRNAYWLIKDMAKKLDPKKMEDFIEERSRDFVGVLALAIEKIWNDKTAIQPAMKALPGYGDLMPVSEWVASVNAGGFIDYDGFGTLAVEHGLSPIDIYPSDITELKLTIPDWATHVLWFNR